MSLHGRGYLCGRGALRGRGCVGVEARLGVVTCMGMATRVGVEACLGMATCEEVLPVGRTEIKDEDTHSHGIGGIPALLPHPFSGAVQGAQPPPSRGLPH